MEKVKITFPDGAKMRDLQTFSGVQFAFASKSKEGKYEQVTAWTTCREGTCGQARRAITKTLRNDSPNPYSDCAGAVDFGRMRMLVYFKKTASKKGEKVERDNLLRRYIERSLGLLNFFEKMGHLKRSKVYLTKHSLPNSNIVYLFEGSGEWMRTPHLVSLYALLIRCGKYEEFEKTKTFKSFLTAIKKAKADYLKCCKDRGPNGYTASRFAQWPFSHQADIDYLVKIGPRMPVLMEQRKQIFSKKKKLEHYQSTTRNTDGIAQLVYGSIQDDETKQRFVANCDKYEIKEISK